MTPERATKMYEVFRAVLECDPSGRAARLDELCGGDVELRGEVERLLADDERAGRDDFLNPPASPIGGADGARPSPFPLRGLEVQIRPVAAIAADRDLLFGLLALQNGLIDQGQLVAAFQAWTRDKARPLAEHLAARGDLDAEQRAGVEAMVALHLKKPGGDAGKSLAALGVGRSTRECLARIGDGELEASLAHVGSGSPEHDGDAARTATYSVGTATSDGQRFRVLRPHAQGGLGAVFVALDAELHREVALKQILDHHADDPISRQRFLLEAEITGALEHPGVVPVYGLGTYGDGRPYYAMRFIRGDSLRQAIERFHADELLKKDPGRRSLELRKLLRRFTDVCYAIDYAHSRGVLHRDIKPGNVIIGKYGETLVVDWGLAKAMGRADPSSAPDERTLVPSSSSSLAETLPGSALGTPAYMSPEQAVGDLDRLGPRSDVYSLGATLYCLLTGKPPFLGDDAGMILRQVQTGEFPSPRALDPSIDRASEAVCLKAMALKPEDRYATPRALAEDVERWMADEPIAAWRESWARRMRRWALQHRPAVAGVAVLLATTLVALSIGIVVVNRERDRTEIARRRTRQALDGMTDQVIEGWLAQQVKLTARQRLFLDTTLRYFEEFTREAGDTPERRLEIARAYQRIAGMRKRLGDTKGAEANFQEALRLTARLAAEFPANLKYRLSLAGAQTNRANTLSSSPGRAPEAESLYRAALATYRELDVDSTGAAEHIKAMAHTSALLGRLLSSLGRTKEAETVCREALAGYRKLVVGSPGNPDHRDSLANSLLLLGDLLRQNGRIQEAEDAYREAIAILVKLAADFPDARSYRENLASGHLALGEILWDTGRIEQAEATDREVVAAYAKLAADFPSVPSYRKSLADSHRELGTLFKHAGRPAEAELSYRQALSIGETLVLEFPTSADYRWGLSMARGSLALLLYYQMGRPSEAERLYRGQLELLSKLVGDFPEVSIYRNSLAIGQNNLGLLLVDLGRLREAEQLYRDSLAIKSRLVADEPANPEYQISLAGIFIDLADLHRRRRQPSEARGLLERGRPHLLAALKAKPQDLQYRMFYAVGTGTLAETLADLGDHAAAAEQAGLLARIATDPAADVYRAARVLARCSALVADDRKLPEARRRGLARSYADQAIESLQRAVASGWKSGEQARHDPDLAPLRARADFRLLLMDADFPGQPFQGDTGRP